MRLPKFRYVEPKSIKEVSTILLDEPGAKILAGGTDILPNMKHKVELPSVVVNIKKIPNELYSAGRWRHKDRRPYAFKKGL